MDLDVAAGALYALPPGRFVAARDDAVQAARQDGDRALAAALGALRRPTVGAWLANLLVRGHRREVEEMVELGSLLRAAQEELDGDQLRELAAQRQRVVAALAAAARTDAAAAGERVGEPAVRELESTLGAALADPQAADQLLEGRLVKAMAYAGLGFSGDVTATSGPRRRSSDGGGVAASGAKGPSGSTRGHDDDAVRVDEAERDLAAARLQAAEAVDLLAAAEAGRREAQELRAAAAKSVEHARSELATAEARLVEADEAVSAARGTEADARAGHKQAQRAVVAAERALARLRR